MADLLAQDTVISITRPEGFALVRITLDEAELLSIAVRPKAQGKGAGAALLAELLARLQGAGVRQLFLEVAEDNAAARALYASAGFGEVGRRRGYYARAEGPAIDALVLRRKAAV